MCIKDNIQKIINEFLIIKTWEVRYEYLIFLGKKLSRNHKNIRNRKNIILGCQSQVWIYSYIKDKKMFYYADSNTIVTRGIAALLLRIYSGQYPSDIISIKPYFLYKIGFFSFLSSNRNNGLEVMYNSIKKYAIYF